MLSEVWPRLLAAVLEVAHWQVELEVCVKSTSTFVDVPGVKLILEIAGQLT